MVFTLALFGQALQKLEDDPPTLYPGASQGSTEGQILILSETSQVCCQINQTTELNRIE